MDPVQALMSGTGAASYPRLRTLGVSRHGLAVAVRQQRVRRVGHGCYALPGVDPLTVAALRLGGVLSCGSAAVSHGLPLLTTGGLHLTVRRSWSHAQFPRVIVHRRDLAPDEHDGLRTTLLRTALDCAREFSLRDGVVVLDAALRAGLDPAGLRANASRAAGRGAAAARRAVQAADGRAESPLETCLRLLAATFGRVEPQVAIPGVGRVDLLLDGWLVLEADGFEHHSNRASYRTDRRRANALAELGYPLLRFSYEDIVHRPGYVSATIAAVLQGRPAA